jgi:hypothetical protein
MAPGKEDNKADSKKTAKEPSRPLSSGSAENNRVKHICRRAPGDYVASSLTGFLFS